MKRAEGRLASVVVAGFAEASGGHIGVVILKGSEEKGKNFRREAFLIGGVFCTFVLCDARTKDLQIPRGGIWEDQALGQCGGTRGVTVFLRFKNFLGEMFKPAGGVGEVERERSGGA